MTDAASDITPRVGDIWQEQDPRHPRFVRIARVDTVWISIYAVEKDKDGLWICARNPHTRKPAPERLAQAKRFNGKRSGYALHHRSNT